VAYFIIVDRQEFNILRIEIESVRQVIFVVDQVSQDRPVLNRFMEAQILVHANLHVNETGQNQSAINVELDVKSTAGSTVLFC